MRIAKPLLAAALLASALPLTGCSPSGDAAPQAHVVVTVAPSSHPERYEVHLAQDRASFRSRFTLTSGETRRVAVPEGWVTVRVAGVCVVPMPTARTTTVEVRPDDCRVV